MSPAPRPKRKNPILPDRLPTRPPEGRGRPALGLLRGAAIGRLVLRHCRECGAVQYPPREACGRCLSERLEWRVTEGAGELLADTVLHHSQELYFRQRLPWRVGYVRLAAGPVVIAHCAGDCPPAPAAVTVATALDRAGQAVLVAGPPAGRPLAEDPRLRDLTADPRGRKALVTDAKSPVGQAIARALLEAGADLVWAGVAEPWKRPPGWAETAALERVVPMPLDVTDTRSVAELGGAIGFKVDILVNTSRRQRADGPLGGGPLGGGIGEAQAAFETHVIGLMRLAAAFGPVMRARGADGANGAVAWVNLLGIEALAPPAGLASHAAALAAAHSLARSLRAELRPGGVRVVNVFPGPIDDEWNQLVQPPKLAPAALARAVVAALKGSVEDVYPGEVARDVLERWLADPKALDMELSR